MNKVKIIIGICALVPVLLWGGDWSFVLNGTNYDSGINWINKDGLLTNEDSIVASTTNDMSGGGSSGYVNTRGYNSSAILDTYLDLEVTNVTVTYVAQYNPLTSDGNGESIILIIKDESKSVASSIGAGHFYTNTVGSGMWGMTNTYYIKDFLKTNTYVSFQGQGGSTDPATNILVDWVGMTICSKPPPIALVISGTGISNIRGTGIGNIKGKIITP